MTGLHVKTFFNIKDIDVQAWDRLSGRLPFQSHQWYTFGERIMFDCSPIYLLVYDNNTLVARASMWLVRNEPLPKMPRPVKLLISALLKRWPLLICRSPMANTSGIIVKDNAQREAILAALTKAAIAHAREKRASIVLFDFLAESEMRLWPSDFVKLRMPSAGTVLRNRWQSLEEFLADGHKKDRKNYRRALREAEKLGIRLTQHKTVREIDAALALIRIVEDRYSSSHNPWMRTMLENIEMIHGTWLEAHIDKRLVGCGLILEDQHVQLTTGLGLADNIPYLYFLLIYASLEAAFTKKVEWLRWGSGAYEVKQRLGFELEQNNNSILFGTNPLTRLLSKLAA
ncbi:MAG TPA: GNAT family N-acetyltransferase [Anaerolineales bacterium]|nr:GNAT family N-acetyltransferase [Anaerolineales bacterium]